AQGGALLIYPLAWLGIGGAAREVWQTKSSDPSARRSVLLVLLAGLVLQTLLFGAMRIPAAPQYYFGTFALHALAALLGMDALRKWRLGTTLGVLYAVGSMFLTLEAAISIHQ